MATLKASEWSDITGHMRVNFPDLVRGWFSTLEPRGLEGGVLTVGAGNSSQVRYLAKHCRRPFVEAAQAATGMLVSVCFETDNPEPAPSLSLSFEQEFPELTLNSDYVFENFVTGPCNRLAHAAAIAVSEKPGRAYNPLFLHGDVGLGKTHLLQAVCHTIQTREPQQQASYISCETFTNHFIEAVEKGALNQFRYRYRHVGILVIDDIQFLAERERSQEEFFHTFNTLHQAQRQIIMSADCCPSEIPSLQERLVSRFNSGLVALMDRPCLETRMAIIRKKAKLRCIEVPEDVVKLIASEIKTNIRELEGALVKTDALSQTRDGIINHEIASEALGTTMNNHMVTIPSIIDRVSVHYGVRVSDLQSRKRTKSVVFPRQVCMYLGRELTKHSLGEIGGFFGGRDHSTVLHSSRLIKEARESDPQLNHALEEITTLLIRGQQTRGSL
ncbi:MAG: chromosomal replication initiator protein DnaA [Phycisphaerae bacterium]|nr:chromosomal replication initiator protein DnaA [Phycisphaerae bacterium]